MNIHTHVHTCTGVHTPTHTRVPTVTHTNTHPRRTPTHIYQRRCKLIIEKLTENYSRVEIMKQKYLSYFKNFSEL